MLSWIKTPSFLERYKNPSDYSLISSITYYSPRATEKNKIGWMILTGMVRLATSGMLSMFQKVDRWRYHRSYFVVPTKNRALYLKRKD
ncbi:hypothetical protein [Fodinibius salsisoli]|uniref:Uncharacterized protein n=1 Tax=Fodinibius salsisoli TaxID=2820877 RepID=A0ABT3PH07_9BACT|nr:hypothetical protein [Fodinibius salsisoli]MCW9705211.1 hypothetical protein [Fodinibius salsisoli]